MVWNEHRRHQCMVKLRQFRTRLHVCLVIIPRCCHRVAWRQKPFRYFTYLHAEYMKSVTVTLSLMSI